MSNQNIAALRKLVNTTANLVSTHENLQLVFDTTKKSLIQKDSVGAAFEIPSTDSAFIWQIKNGGTNSNVTLTNDKVMVSVGGAIVESAVKTSELTLLSGMSSVSTGTSDNDKLVTKGYVDDHTVGGGSVNSVNTINPDGNGNVSLTQDNIPDGTTFVQTHNDFSDTYKSYINQGVKKLDTPTFAGARVGEVGTDYSLIYCQPTSVERDFSRIHLVSNTAHVDGGCFIDNLGSGTLLNVGGDLIVENNGDLKLNQNLTFKSQLLTGLSTGTSDNDKLVTQGYVDDHTVGGGSVNSVNTILPDGSGNVTISKEDIAGIKASDNPQFSGLRLGGITEQLLLNVQSLDAGATDLKRVSLVGNTANINGAVFIDNVGNGHKLNVGGNSVVRSAGETVIGNSATSQTYAAMFNVHGLQNKYAVQIKSDFSSGSYGVNIRAGVGSTANLVCHTYDGTEILKLNGYGALTVKDKVQASEYEATASTPLGAANARVTGLGEIRINRPYADGVYHNYIYSGGIQIYKDSDPLVIDIGLTSAKFASGKIVLASTGKSTFTNTETGNAGTSIVVDAFTGNLIIKDTTDANIKATLDKTKLEITDTNDFKSNYKSNYLSFSNDGDGLIYLGGTTANGQLIIYNTTDSETASLTHEELKLRSGEVQIKPNIASAGAILKLNGLKSATSPTGLKDLKYNPTTGEILQYNLT